MTIVYFSSKKRSVTNEFRYLVQLAARRLTPLLAAGRWTSQTARSTPPCTLPTRMHSSSSSLESERSCTATTSLPIALPQRRPEGSWQSVMFLLLSTRRCQGNSR